MALASYSDLKSSIENWLARSDLSGVADDFIDMFEAEFSRNMRLEDMLTDTTLTTSSSTSTVNLPTNFLQMENLSFDSKPRDITFITKKQMQQIRAGNQNGRPTAYTITSSSTSGGQKRVLFAPTPDGTYTLTATHYVKLPALSASNTSNWLLASNPDVYLYGCLKQATTFTSDTERKMEFKQAYEQAMRELDLSNEGNKAGGHGMRVTTDTGNP